MSWLRQNWAALIIPAGVLVIALAGYSLFAPPNVQGGPATTFSRPVMAGPGSVQGDRISLESYAGQVLILDFWASWCPPCRDSIPILNRIDTLEGVNVVGVNTESLGAEELRTAHADFRAAFPTIQDASGELSDAYRVTQLPTSVIIAPSGDVARIDIGVPNESELQAFVEELAAGH
ncbi:MAG: TlpA disulfide reductase family protein [Myxococcota bacterium]